MRSLVLAVLVVIGVWATEARGGGDPLRSAVSLRGAVDAQIDPGISFIASPHLGRGPLTVSFDARRATVPIAPLQGPLSAPRGRVAQPGEPMQIALARAVLPEERYMWDFGDGSMGLGKLVMHTYTQPSEYEATLIVVASGAIYSSAPLVVTVSDGSYDIDGPVTEHEAGRFLWQAAFGPRPADVAAVMSSGYEAWIDAQIAMPPTRMNVEDLEYSIDMGYGYGPESLWDDLSIEAPDQLRQRMAWALLQILVMNNPQDTASADLLYYSEYIEHALGNYRDLLGYVTRSHQMGIFLTYINNVRANPSAGTVPDENYAREALQLFSIGLWMLNPDGTRMLDMRRSPIPSFNNTTVQQFARIFTGFRWGQDFAGPMPMFATRHEFGEKQLLNYPGAIPAGGYIPAITSTSQQTVDAALADVDAALDNIFHHPNCAPFISDLLIKRLVTSNPTPAYVRRVAEAFAGFGPYGTGIRGDLAATAKAILLDPEARDPAYRTNPAYGKVKEPLVTRWALYRLLERIDRPTETFPFRINAGTSQIQLEMGQSFMGSPSVFNFYVPNHIPPRTDLAIFEMFGPELQIYNDFTALATQNRFHDELVTRSGTAESLRYAAWRILSDDPAALVAELNDELMHGTLTDQSRQIIVSALSAITGSTDRVRTAVWLIVNSPEFRVLK